jgi:hypothetical protein
VANTDGRNVLERLGDLGQHGLRHVHREAVDLVSENDGANVVVLASGGVGNDVVLSSTCERQDMSFFFSKTEKEVRLT